MPWKGEKNPYKVWLSEVILQQTRVGQGWEYFERFVGCYPTIEALAAANDQEVFKLWEGLGYYNRCKNLLITARLIVNKFDGIFPADYETILSLKWVGTYTAAAIASFCFNLPYAVLDGNVFRVLARVFAIDTPIDGKDAKNTFATLAEKLLYTDDPGAFNQAMMDFGATVCKPALPLCGNCALQSICEAYKNGKANLLPIKEKVLRRKKRWFTYFVFECEGKVLVQQRTGTDIWQNLFEFYLVETPDNPKWTTQLVFEWLANQLGVMDAGGFYITAAACQKLTHQEINGYFIKLTLPEVAASLQAHQLRWVTKAEVDKMPFPKFITQFIAQQWQQAQLF